MKISIAATNPCHLYPLARELAARQALGCYYSGYPAWKLGDDGALPMLTHSLRTTIVYGLLKYVPESCRPDTKRLFRWQDHGFDRWAGARLATCDYIHGMPGQCLHLFRAARQRGIATVLNHATGPVRDWVRIMEPEYARVGLRLTDVCPYDAAYFEREEEEYELADWHCAASSVVCAQLGTLGIDPRRIWHVPYGADSAIFHGGNGAPPEDFRIIFAGQVGLRKGLHCLLDALTLADRAEWRMDFHGAVLGESRRDLDAYRGATPLSFHGAVSQQTLATAFRASSVLVLPSLEEGFGLVVPQALNCGLPVIVSDRVGGKDLVRHRQNGSIFPAGDSNALASELLWWKEHPQRVQETFDWSAPAARLIECSAAGIKK